MTGDSLEFVRHAYESVESFLALLDEDVVFDNEAYPLPDFDPGAKGKEAVTKFFFEYWRSFTDYAVEPLEAIEVGDRIVVVHRETGGGAGSGISLERVFAVVWDLRNGKITRIKPFQTREDALAAVKESR